MHDYDIRRLLEICNQCNKIYIKLMIKINSLHNKFLFYNTEYYRLYQNQSKLSPADFMYRDQCLKEKSRLIELLNDFTKYQRNIESIIKKIYTFIDENDQNCLSPDHKKLFIDEELPSANYLTKLSKKYFDDFKNETLSEEIAFHVSEINKLLTKNDSKSSKNEAE